MVIFCKPSENSFYKKAAIELLKKYGMTRQTDVLVLGRPGGNYIIIETASMYSIESKMPTRSGAKYVMPKQTDEILTFLNSNLISDIKPQLVYCVREFDDGYARALPGETARIHSVSRMSDDVHLHIGPDYAYSDMNESRGTGIIRATENKYFTNHMNRANRILDYENNTDKRFSAGL